MSKCTDLPAERSQQASLPVNVDKFVDALVPALIKKMQQDGSETSLSISSSSSSSFSGPLPPSAEFERYNQVIPGAGDRILKMAEKEQQLREAGQKGAIRNDAKRISGAVILGLTLIAVSGLATWLGNPIIALPLGLAGILTAFTRQVLNLLRLPHKED